MLSKLLGFSLLLLDFFYFILFTFLYNFKLFYVYNVLPAYMYVYYVHAWYGQK